MFCLVLLVIFCLQCTPYAQFIQFPPIIAWENFEHSTTLYDVESNITTATTGLFRYLAPSQGQRNDLSYYLRQTMTMWGHTFVSQYWVVAEQVRGCFGRLFELTMRYSFTRNSLLVCFCLLGILYLSIRLL
jgi:hypothetical protein